MILRMIFLAIGGLVLAACGEKDPSAGGQETMAFVMCQRPVKSQLRAPSTAEFPTITATGTSSLHEGNGIYDIQSYVDAQNGFGAMIRSNYSCKIKENADHTWSLIDLKIQ